MDAFLFSLRQLKQHWLFYEHTVSVESVTTLCFHYIPILGEETPGIRWEYVHNTAVHQLLVSRAEQGHAEGHNYNQEAKPPSTAEHSQTFTPLLFTRRSRLEPNESTG